MIFSALKPVILRDSDSFRQNLFSALKERSRIVRFAEKTYFFSPPIIRSWMLLAYGLKSFFDAPELTRNISCVYSYKNEKTRFEYLQEIFGSRILDYCKVAPFQDVPEKIFLLTRNLSDLLRLLHFLKFISGRFDFLVSCRISATIFFYFWFNREAPRRKPQAVLLSSEANPYAMAMLWVAKKHSIRTIYVPHGQVSPHPPRLHFDLSLLDGEEIKTTFEETARSAGEIIFKGTDGEFIPLRLEGLLSPRIVGIFLSVIYESVMLEKTIRQIHARFPGSTLLIRLHPNETLFSSEILTRIRDLKIITNTNQTLEKEIKECDVVFCGNSGTHLETLRQGVPTIQVPGLDLFPHDTRKFIENKIVPFFSDPGSVNVEELREFYSVDWINRMKKYDHFYGTQKAERNQILRKQIDDWFNGLETSDSDQRAPGRRT